MKEGNVFLKIKDVSFVELLMAALLVEFVILFFLFFFTKTQEAVRDSIRKRDLSQIGQIITDPCFVPKQFSANKEYDLYLVLSEMINGDDLYQSTLPQIMKDPKTGTDAISMYIYKISEDGQKCSLYANLESSLSRKTLEINDPTPGGGTGILESRADGWNGSSFYFQYSN